jgi:WD40 repeat protein
MQLGNEPLDDVPLPPKDFHPSPVAQTVNVLWFTSLLLSLFAALFGIFVKQWLHTYSNWSDVADAREAVLLRGFYRSGLKLWHVSNIVAMLPLLLQVALLFFVAGLVIYLWTLDYVVAGFLSVLVVAGIAIAMVAIALPVRFPSCSFKSPLGFLLVRIFKSAHYSSWRERDLDVVKQKKEPAVMRWEKDLVTIRQDESLESLESPDPIGEQLNTVNQDIHVHVYSEVCALLEITPTADGLGSTKKKRSLVATRVNELEVHAEQSPFDLLRAIISVYAHSRPSVTQPKIVKSMLQVLLALAGGRKYTIPGPVIRGFVQHVVEMRLQELDSSGLEAQLSSLREIAEYIVYHGTTPKNPGLIELAGQLLDCLQQWMSTASVHSDDAFGHEKHWRTLHNVLGSKPLMSLNHPASVLCVAVSPDGTSIVSGSVDNTVRVWDASTGAVLRTLEGHTNSVTSVAFSPDGTRIVSGSCGKTVRVWDASTGAVLRTLEGHTDLAISVVFSPDGTRIVSGSSDKTVRVWDASTGAVLCTLEGHTEPVMSVVFSPDGTRIVSGSDDETVRVWDASTGAVLRILEGHTGDVRSVAFSPDGTSIVSGSFDRTVRVWDARTGAVLRTLEGHTGYVLSVALSPDGTRIVSGSSDKTVRVWDASTGAVLCTLEGHTEPVMSVVFSPDGTRIVSGWYDMIVRVWDASTGAVLRTLEGDTGYVRSVAFSPDRTRIVSYSDDNTVRVWDVSTGVVLRTLEGHTGYVLSVAFSPDGSSITAQSAFGGSHTWIAPRDFPPPANPPVLFSLSSSPIFSLEDGWIIGRKDSQAVARRLFWVVPNRRGKLWSHGHCVVLDSRNGIMTVLNFTGMI